MFEDPQRVEQLYDLCSINLKAVNPKIVIVSGKLITNSAATNFTNIFSPLSSLKYSIHTSYAFAFSR